MKLQERIKQAVIKNNPHALLEVARTLVNKDSTLSISERHTVMDIVDTIIGNNILDLQNSLVVERHIDKLPDDILYRVAKKAFKEAYDRVYEEE